MKLKADKIKILNMTRMRELKDDKLDFITDPRYTEGIYRLGISDTRATGEVDGVHYLNYYFKFKKISEINIKSTIISKFEKNRWT